MVEERRELKARTKEEARIKEIEACGARGSLPGAVPSLKMPSRGSELEEHPPQLTKSLH